MLEPKIVEALAMLTNGSNTLNSLVKIWIIYWVASGISLWSHRWADLEVLFDDTIYHNIHYGLLSATEEEVFDAARHAAIHDSIMNFPEKYSTIVGERGLKLSGGEKQRVSLARAFLKAPSILLCDEATSALDSTTEAEILNALKTLSKNRTSIFIAHRLTIAMQCDEIIVLENGKVVEQGPHEVLLSNAGRYAQLWLQQNSNEAIDTLLKVVA